MKRLLFSTPSLVGLDVLPNEIRLVQLKKTKRGFILERLITSRLSETIFSDGKIKHWQSLSHALFTLVKAEKLQGLAASLILPANLVRMQRIQLPLGLTDTEIEAEICAHMQRGLPGMSDALCIDFNQTVIENSAYSEVFFAAVRQEYLLQYVECVNESGLIVKMADVDLYTLQRAISFGIRPSVKADEVNAILYMTNAIALFMVFNDQEILFYQYLDKLTSSNLIAQLKNKMQMYLATFKNKALKTLAVCGEEAFIHLLKIETVWPFELQIIYPEPFAHMKMASTVDTQFCNQEAFNFFMACGAAMREVPRW